MTKYTVALSTHASTFIDVEADSPEDAVNKALHVGGPSICARCAGWGQDAGIELGEWDFEEGTEEGNVWVTGT